MLESRCCRILTVVVTLGLGLRTGIALAECQSQLGQCAELVKPAQRDGGRWAGARCNDGTAWALYHRPSATPVGDKTWVIYLDGGGYCDDNSKPCHERARYLTTTVNGGDGATVDFPNSYGIFDL